MDISSTLKLLQFTLLISLLGAVSPARLANMKRYLRFCLIVLLSLALPLSGMAGLAVAAEPCPMKAAGMEMMGDMEQDCCADLDNPSDHDKPCKSGQECKTSSILQVSTVKPPATMASPIVAPSFSETPLAQAPSGVWRPPRV